MRDDTSSCWQGSQIRDSSLGCGEGMGIRRAGTRSGGAGLGNLN